jgi:hypothetical protein
MSAAVLLQQIEKQLGINIHHLFDMVSGTNTGALSALGFGVCHMAGACVIELFWQASKYIPEIAKKPKNKHKLLCKIAARLEQFISNKPMFVGSQMPRVAITVTDSEIVGFGCSQTFRANYPHSSTLSQLAVQACLPAHYCTCAKNYGENWDLI